MAGQATATHVARIRSGYTDKRGQRREYESRYLRRTYRDGGKVRHETLANLSGLPEQAVDAIEAALKGTALVPAAHAVGSPGRCRTGTSPRSTRWRPNWACPACSARPARTGT